MKKRIGNDIHFAWTVNRKYEDGTVSPESFENKTVELVLLNSLGRPAAITVTAVNTGIVQFEFAGKDQTMLGDYTAVLYENRNDEGMVTLDSVHAVTLVRHTQDESDNDALNITSEAVELEGTIGYSGGGGSVDAYTKAETDELLSAKADVIALESEIEERKAADKQLQTNIDAEADTRLNQITSLDNDMQGRFSTVYSDIAILKSTVAGKADKTDLPTKTSELENDSDYTTNEALNTKATEIYQWANGAITSAVTPIGNSLGQEIQDRYAADNELQQNINNEVTARTEADETLNQSLAGKQDTAVEIVNTEDDAYVVNMSKVNHDTIYRLGELQSLSVGNMLSLPVEVVIYFSAGDDGCTVTISKPYNLVGDIDTSEAGNYVLAIHEGTIFFGTATTNE